MVALLAAAACTKQPSDVPSDARLVPVQIAVSVGNTAPVYTKGNPSVISEMDQVFRGICEVTMIPFKSAGGVSENDRSLYHPAYLPDITAGFYPRAFDGTSYVTGLVENNNAHLYSKQEANLPDGTASVLVYGRPPKVELSSAIEKNHLNGALSESGLAPQPTLRSASDITFDPVAICPGGIPAEAEGIAAVLNSIVTGVTYTELYWYQDHSIPRDGAVTISWNEDINDTWLRELFQWFTNNGNLTSGAGYNVEYMITRLYRILKENYVSSDTSDYEHITSGNVYSAIKRGSTEHLTYADLYNGIRDQIIARIEELRDNGTLIIRSDHIVTFASLAYRTYPASYGLPDGAAVVQWTGVEYKAVSQMLDGVAPLEQYCYPPELWYFVNTTISTSTQDRDDLYTKDNLSWKNDILSTYSSGKVLHSSTKSAALDSALQYSCAMLVATVRASSAQLDDADGLNSTRVPLGTANIPVTGVIIGSQRKLRYDFTPLDGVDYFLYDNCIDGLYLTKTEQESAPRFKTLVSQTPDGEPVYFCLEMRNDSGSSFTGADGLVLPGAKFYLVGSIELPQDDSYQRAFEQDHTTTINCLVSSLSDARTAIPDLEHPHLSVGLQVNVNWVEATPSYLVLY